MKTFFLDLRATPCRARRSLAGACYRHASGHWSLGKTSDEGVVVLACNKGGKLVAAFYLPGIGWQGVVAGLYILGESQDVFVPRVRENTNEE